MLRLSFAFVLLVYACGGRSPYRAARQPGEAAAPPPRIAHDAVFFARQRGEVSW